MKKTTTIKIDENILYLAKREIPNISQFVEDCLKTYLDLGMSEDNVTEMQDAINTIRDAKIKIHLLSESQEHNQKVQAFSNKNQDETWIGIWASYRNGGGLNDGKILDAQTTLQRSYGEIVDMMNLLITFLPKSELPECDSWSYAKAKYEELK